jgi:hypothetical protein
MRFTIPLEVDKDTEAHQASSKGAPVNFRGPKPTVIDGPFAESKELIAGLRAPTAAKR